MQPERDYEVGYGKPPKHSQFKKGQSGNPKGRPRKSKMLDSILAEVLDETVTITENGRRKKINKAEGMFKALVNRAVQGDIRAAQIAVRMMEGFARHKKKSKPAAENDKAPVSAVVVLPDNGRDPIDPELLEEYARVKTAYDLRNFRQAGRSQPVNANERPPSRSGSA